MDYDKESILELLTKLDGDFKSAAELASLKSKEKLNQEVNYSTVGDDCFLNQLISATGSRLNSLWDKYSKSKSTGWLSLSNTGESKTIANGKDLPKNYEFRWNTDVINSNIDLIKNWNN